MDIPVPTKNTNASVKSWVSKESSRTKINEQQKKPVKVSTTEVMETEKPISSFSLENEINKIKIPIPLVELMKTDPFRKYVLKELHPPDHVNFSDTKAQREIARRFYKDHTHKIRACNVKVFGKDEGNIRRESALQKCCQD